MLSSLQKSLVACLVLSTVSCLGRLDQVEMDPAALLQGLLAPSTDDTSTPVTGYQVGGTIYGEVPTGLQLSFSGTGCGTPQSSSIGTTGAYHFSGIPDGCSAASIAITTQPTSVFCQIYNATGRTVSSADINDIDLYCFDVALPAGPLTIYEGGTLTVSVHLTASPGPSATTITFTSDNPAVTTASSFTFTAGDYSTAQDLILSHPVDANSTAENAVITANSGVHAVESVTVSTHDTTSGSTDRYIFVTTDTHNGDFAGDGSLDGNNWMEKADSFCSASSSVPGAILGQGNFRAVLTDGTLRSATIGSQVNWVMRPGINYSGPDNLPFQVVDANGIIPVPVTNLLTGGGNYWTGLANALTWPAGSTCLNWSDASTGNSGSYAIATFNTTNLFAYTSQTCDTPKSLLCVQDLKDRGDGTVSSAYQNLLWQKCETNQTWDGACTGSFSPVSFCSAADDSCNGGSPTGTLDGGGTSSAYNYCASLTMAGRTWRVPTVAELQELFRASRSVPTLFPGLSTSQYYISSESDSTTNARAVLFLGGTVGTLNKTNLLRVRCVSDGM